MTEHTPAAGPFVTNDAVQFQSGSVVSKTLINKTTGTVTLFAFDVDQSLSEHTAPFDALAVILDGEALISVGGIWHTVKGGETILLPANLPHALKAVIPYKMMLVMIKN